MAQSAFRWALVSSDGATRVVVSTLADLPNLIDWSCEDIVAIIQLELL